MLNRSNIAHVPNLPYLAPAGAGAVQIEAAAPPSRPSSPPSRGAVHGQERPRLLLPVGGTVVLGSPSSSSVLAPAVVVAPDVLRRKEIRSY